MDLRPRSSTSIFDLPSPPLPLPPNTTPPDMNHPITLYTFPLCGHACIIAEQLHNHLAGRELCPGCVAVVRAHAVNIILRIFEKVDFPAENDPQEIVYSFALDIFRDNPLVIHGADISPIAEQAYKKLLALAAMLAANSDAGVTEQQQHSKTPNPKPAATNAVGLPSSVPLLSGTFKLPAGFSMRSVPGNLDPICRSRRSAVPLPNDSHLAAAATQNRESLAKEISMDLDASETGAEPSMWDLVVEEIRPNTITTTTNNNANQILLPGTTPPTTAEASHSRLVAPFSAPLSASANPHHPGGGGGSSSSSSELPPQQPQPFDKEGELELELGWQSAGGQESSLLQQEDERVTKETVLSWNLRAKKKK